MKKKIWLASFFFVSLQRTEKGIMSTSYRPHNSGHDYHDRGVYLITLVVRDREPILGRLNNDPYRPLVELSDIGCAVADEWEKTSSIQVQRGNRVRLLSQVVMPDHWHGVLAVDERLDRSVGAIIQATKSACTVAYRRLCGISVPPSCDVLQPSLVARQSLQHMSPLQRAAYYAPSQKNSARSLMITMTIPYASRNATCLLCYTMWRITRVALSYVACTPITCVAAYMW